MILSVTTSDSIRLDQYLFQQKVGTSRSILARWIKEGHVLLNNKKTKPSQLVELNDSITVTIPDIKPSELEACDMALDIIFEDKNLAVINKPAHLVVHPGAGNREKTLTQALLYHFKGLSSIGGVERPGIVHRLDKGTSGVMLVAKNDKTHVYLSDLFKNHQIEKTYLAICYGTFKSQTGTIKTGIARSKSDRKKFSVADDGKMAITHYKVMAEGNQMSLVEVKIETGRTHQIRVHLTNLGHPLVGDETYGGHLRRLKNFGNKKISTALKKIDHPLLHAKKIKILAPLKKEWNEWGAIEPDDFMMVKGLIT